MLGADGQQWLLALADVEGPAERARYFVPLALAFAEADEERTRALAGLAVSRVRQQAAVGLLADAMADEPFCRALVRAIGAGRELPADGGRLRFTPSSAFAEIVGDALRGPLPLHRLATSSNSVTLLGERLFLKAYRRLYPGVNPEAEMGRFLTDVAGFAHCVPVAGSVEFRSADGTAWTLAMLQAQVSNQGDAWTFTVDQLVRLLESLGAEAVAPDEGIRAMARRMQVLARRVAELHVALARRTGNAAFDPEPVQAADLERWSRSVQDESRHTLDLLARRRGQWAEPLAALAARVLDAAPKLGARMARAAAMAPAGVKTRVHGDLHLGQVLIRQDDFVFIDFEGEPQRPLEERRAKHSALRDVAGMLRSFDYVRHTSLHRTTPNAAEIERLGPAAREWERQVRAAFLQTYGEVAVEGGLYTDPAAFEAASPLLDLFELEKALYELRYEMDNRPDWVGVPLAGIAALAGIPD
jgi:maltose alpha-D-glucosyltransferase/alpha-amylase